MFAVIRVRGSIHLKPQIKETLALLNLNRVNRMVIVPETESYKKMLAKVKDYVTWGEINKKMLIKALEKRGRKSRKKRIDKKFLKEKELKSIKELAEKIIKGKKPQALGLKPFALKPPSKGFERQGIKKPYSIGGALGYRGKKINELIKIMI